MKNTKKQFGFSLVELMVGMVVGLLVSGIVITAFTQSKNSYNQDEEIAQLQENGRYVLQLLSRELSMAGFAGDVFKDAGVISGALTGSVPCGFASLDDIVAEPIIFPSTTPSCISGVKADTDILVIKRVAGSPTAVPSAGTLYLQTSAAGDKIIVGGVDPSAIAPAKDWELLVRIYYIKDITVGGNTIPTLRRSQLTSPPDDWDDVELVQGIENIQITFGIDSNSNGAVTSYVTSSTNLSQAILAKVDILARSVNEDHGYDNNRTYYIGSTAIDNLKDTHYYGRVFSTTVPMRNISYRNKPL